jgi:hypothetical protein
MQKRWVRILLSVVLSFALWFSTRLVREQDVQVSIPIAYDNLPPQYVRNENLQRRLDLNVRGQGHLMLLPLWRLENDSLRIDLSQYASQRFVLSRSFRAGVQGRLPESVRITGISPDTLPLDFVHKFSRQVGIRARTRFVPAPGYYVTKVEFMPDSLRLQGPEDEVSGISLWNTVHDNGGARGAPQHQHPTPAGGGPRYGGAFYGSGN